MLRRKTEQLHSEEQERTSEDSLVVFRSRLKRRGLALGAALALLIGVLIAGTVAWYTQLSNITGMTMKAAKIDIRANYVDKDDIVILAAGDYLNQKNAAPGSKGILPIRVDAPKSDAAIDYTLSLNFNAMADEFRNRLRFYYYKVKDGKTYEVTFDPATAATVDSVISGTVPQDDGSGTNVNYEYIYWEWVYDLEDDWFCHDGIWYYKGEVKSGDPLRVNYKLESKTVANATFADYPDIGKNSKAGALYNAIYPDTPYSAGDPNDPEHFPPDPKYDPEKPEATPRSEAVEAYDAFDSVIGLGEAEESIKCTLNGKETTLTQNKDSTKEVEKLPAYQQAMLAKLYVTGTQAKPMVGAGQQGSSAGTPGSIFYTQQ